MVPGVGDDLFLDAICRNRYYDDDTATPTAIDDDEKEKESL
ncbi:13561_t:CDS:2 [Acaulospora morrowiae]|uniref:13561_t:CDS:1 n=1 Tax=Acaulospora morrowiae TaxID=94023 RepID=A0A9N9HA42_9GLOM|nr:13561_t:CDS:2 [Acaulospora morrowiae]